MKRVQKREKGITLVALVVTIVVLLILAGVSLNLVIGNNGLIKKAQEAKKKTEVSNVQELARLAYSEVYMEDLTKTPTEVMNNVVNKLNKEGYTTVPYTGSNDNNISGIALIYNGESIDNTLNLNIEEEETQITKKIRASFTLESTDEKLEYLVTINGKQHRMIYENKTITISDEEENEDSNSNISRKITITPNNVDGISIKIGDKLLNESTEIDSGTEIIIEATSDVTEDASLTMKYDEIEKIYNISVNRKVTLKAGDCVMYSYVDSEGNVKNEKFIVLYDDEYNKTNNVNYGIQIISNASLEVFEMNDSKWYNAESILNGLAEKYMRGSSIALNARCVGSLPTDSYSDFTSGYNNDNYLIDVNQMKTCQCFLINNQSYANGTYYYLASRYYYQVLNDGVYTGRWYHYIRNVSHYNGGNVSQGYTNYYQAMNNYNTLNYGYRPVITINGSKFYAKGRGTRDNPYILKNE